VRSSYQGTNHAIHLQKEFDSLFVTIKNTRSNIAIVVGVITGSTIQFGASCLSTNGLQVVIKRLDERVETVVDLDDPQTIKASIRCAG